MFLVKLETPVSQLQIQETEVDAVRLFSFEELQKCMLQKHPTYRIVPADMSYYQFVMDEVLKNIIISSSFAKCKINLNLKLSL